MFLFILAAGPAVSQSSADCPQPTGNSAEPLVYRTLGDDFAAEISARMLDYLNTTGSAAGLEEWLQPDTDGIDAKVIEADVTGDGADNLLVNVSSDSRPLFHRCDCPVRLRGAALCAAGNGSYRRFLQLVVQPAGINCDCARYE